MLEFFATDDAVAALEAALSAAQAGSDAAVQAQALVAVAWQLRQRDTPRALALADEAACRLASAEFSGAEQQRLAARLMLIRGEASWLSGELDAAKNFAESALLEFKGSCDEFGCADAHWLRAWIAHDQGDGALRDAAYQAMAAAAADIDPIRVTVARAALARFVAFGDAGAAMAQWLAQGAAGSNELHPAAAYWVEDFLDLVAALGSDFVSAIRHGSKAYDLAVASGQVWRASVAATNVGDSFVGLNEYRAALEWMQCGLDLARASGWPSNLGMALSQTANALRHLKRFDAAAAMLRESMALLSPVAASRSYAMAVRYLAEVEFDRRDYASALETFAHLEQRAVALRQTDLWCEALLGQAKAMHELDRPQSALEKAHAALTVAKTNTADQIDILRVLADIHVRHALQSPPGVVARSASMHYLQLALDAAGTIENFTVPGGLLETLACEYAKIGDHAKAYELVVQANQARERIHSTEAANRASALQVGHETEKARLDAEHQRQLAQSHAARAQSLEQANETLEALGLIGREITGSLDADTVFEALHRHLGALLDVTSFSIYRLDTAGATLTRVFGREEGRALPAWSIRLDSATSKAARAVRERQEQLLELAPDEFDPNHVPGTRRMLTALFAPLTVGERMLGVLTIQSDRERAFRQRERLIFRTLCAYGAIALANAEAQVALKLTQDELHQALAATRAIVDNAPIGIHLVDAQGRVTQVNKAYLELTGFGADELIGESTAKVWPDANQYQAVADAAMQSIRDGKRYAIEGPLRRRDGVKRWMRCHIAALRERDQSAGMVVTVEDVTERRDAERKVRESLAMVQSIIDSSPVGLYLLDKDGRMSHINRACCDLAGYRPEEILGHTIVRMFASHDEFQHFTRKAFAVLSAGRTFSFEHQYRRRDGSLIWLRSSSNFIRPRDASSGVVTAVEDISERKQAELDLIASRDEAHAALEQLRAAQAQLIQSEKMASLGQLVANVAHEINTPIAAVKSSGQSIAEALDEALIQLPHLFERLEAAHRELFIQLLSHIRDPRPSISSREERAARRETARELAQEGIADAEAKAEVLVQIGAQEALVLYLPLLRHPECRLILAIAHSIGTVINGTRNINTAVERVAKIVFALKSFSRVDKSGEMQAANLREGIDTVLTIYHNQIKQGVELVLNVEDIPPIRCFADELNQVWTNLIHNALQAMDYRGTLTVGIGREGGDAVVSIGDSGCGIPEEIRPRIFDPFFTTKPAGEGSGLGLDIVRKIVDKHHGWVEFVSTVGGGTTFTVRLPYAAEAVAAANAML